MTETYLNASPIFAGFDAASAGGIGHAVVIQGYVNIPSTGPTVSYMDPTDGTYRASSIPSNGKPTIIVTGTTRAFLAGFAVYD